MRAVKFQFLAANSLAPHADNFNTAGPLNPQCVITKGPSCSSLDCAIFILANGTLTPINLVIGCLGKFKVNNEGTGVSI